MIQLNLVEDDDAAAALLAAYAARYEQESGAKVSFIRYASGEDFLAHYQPGADVVFLDIELPGINGLAVAKQLRERDQNVALVFVTNMAQYAIKGYEVNALDYVLKPVEYFTFTAKLAKAMSYRRNLMDYTLTIQHKDGASYLQASQLLYIEIRSHSLIYHTLSGDVEGSGSLKMVEAQLGDARFVRCNSCYLVNLRYVSAVVSEDVYLGKVRLKISRPRRKDFLRRLVSYKGEVR
jgi:two-component system response regulator LytT